MSSILSLCQSSRPEQSCLSGSGRLVFDHQAPPRPLQQRLSLRKQTWHRWQQHDPHHLRTTSANGIDR
jgi:hypothetical protein